MWSAVWGVFLSSFERRVRPTAFDVRHDLHSERALVICISADVTCELFLYLIDYGATQ